jgi:glycosyltransferase involved in cell wall biosynthesis
MNAPPRLSIGLPVYNGERYLSESIEALLGQSYEDFELIISDNASTDDTPSICRRYEKQDARIRYIRQPRNIGLVPNHNFVADQAQGELFKWAAHDDLYAQDLLERCVEALDEHPQVVFAHSWSALVDSSGNATKLIKYPEGTASSCAPERFRSMLFDGKYDYGYAVIRTDVLRRVRPHDSYHYADKTIVAELALHGQFHQVEGWLYFRRDRPDERRMSTRERCAVLDPRRADRVRNPAIRLYGEYIWAYMSAIHHAPLSATDRRDCYLWLARWLANRAVPPSEPQGQPVAARKQPLLYAVRRLASLALPGRDVRVGEVFPAQRPDLNVDDLVPGRDKKAVGNA